jgi:hypothetical protein
VRQDNKGIEKQLSTKNSEVGLKKKKREADRVYFGEICQLFLVGKLPYRD